MPKNNKLSLLYFFYVLNSFDLTDIASHLFMDQIFHRKYPNKS